MSLTKIDFSQSFYSKLNMILYSHYILIKYVKVKHFSQKLSMLSIKHIKYINQR